jgi:hypothetical protein
LDEAIQTIQSEAGKLAHILDMQGLVALLAHVLHQQAKTVSEIDDKIQDEEGYSLLSGNSKHFLTEDQVYSIILHRMSQVEEVVLGTDESLTGSSNVEVPLPTGSNA